MGEYMEPYRRRFIPILFIAVQFSYGELAAERQDHVKNVSFIKDVAQILDKRNCSATNCHGGIYGKGGLSLSAFTCRPEADAAAIALAEKGRRVNLLMPVNSLFLVKGANKIPHGGGELMPVGSDDYKTCLAWIMAGANLEKSPVTVSKLEVSPARVVLKKDQEKLQLKVTVLFSDGDERDMTSHARYFTDATSVADILNSGAVMRTGTGTTTAVVRVLGHTAEIEIVCPAPGDVMPAAMQSSVSVWTGGLLNALRQTDSASFRLQFRSDQRLKLFDEKLSNKELIEQLYTRIFGAGPDKEELKDALDHLQDSQDRRKSLDEWTFVILTSRACLSGRRFFRSQKELPTN